MKLQSDCCLRHRIGSAGRKREARDSVRAKMVLTHNLALNRGKNPGGRVVSSIGIWQARQASKLSQNVVRGQAPEALNFLSARAINILNTKVDKAQVSGVVGWV